MQDLVTVAVLYFIDDYDVDIQIADQSGRPLKLPPEERKVDLFHLIAFLFLGVSHAY